MKRLIYFQIIIFLPIVLCSIQPKTVLLQPGQTCQDFFLRYKEEQTEIYAIKDDENSYLSIDNLKMPSFIIVCEKMNPSFATVYKISKTGDLHTEQMFFVSFLMEKLKQQDDNTIYQAKRAKLYNRGDERKRSKSTPLRKTVFDKVSVNRKESIQFIKEAKKEYENISYQIYIYMFKSPCSMCLNAYNNIIKSFPNLEIKVYFTSFFRFLKDSILYDQKIRNLEVTSQCLSEFDSSKKNELKTYKYLLKKKQRNEILECINKKTISTLQAHQNNKQLSFYQISVKSSYAERIKDLKKILGLYTTN